MVCWKRSKLGWKESEIGRPKKTHKKKEKSTESAVVEAIPIEEINCIPTDAEPGTGRIISTGSVMD